MSTPVVDSALLAAIVPYEWIFALFVLVPPPPLTLPRTCNRPQSRHSHYYYRLLHTLYVLYMIVMLSLTLWITYVHNIIVYKVVNEQRLDNITHAITISVNFAVSLCQGLMQATSIFGYRQLCNIFLAIATLELDIRAAEPRRQRFGFRWRLAGRSGCLLLFLSLSIPIANYHLIADSMRNFDKLVAIFFTLLVQVKCVEFCVMAEMVHELLVLLLEDLKRLRREILMCDRAELRYMLCKDLQRHQRLVARIWHLVIAIENYFALPMLALFFHNGLAITHTMNWAYIRFMTDGLNIFRIGFAVVVVLNMLVACWTAQCCIDVYNSFSAILHNLKSCGTEVALNMRLQEYSLQLMHQQMLFTCSGFFDINLKHFGGVRELFFK